MSCNSESNLVRTSNRPSATSLSDIKITWAITSGIVLKLELVRRKQTKTSIKQQRQQQKYLIY